MKLVIEYKSDKPIYQQIYEQISFQILKGELDSDFCLPSIRNVARELGISIITVKNAYENLEQDGYIYTVAGKGCFVKSNKEILSKKRNQLIEERLQADFDFYQSLGLSKEDLMSLYKDKLKK